MAVHFAPAAVEAALDKRFAVTSQIAVGGQGAVFRATRVLKPDGTAGNEVVALKLHLYHTQDVRAQREIAAMENITHPALARMIEQGSCDVAGRRTRYVAWEFIEGQTLSQQLKLGKLEEPEVLAVGRDVSAAIAEIWSRQIVHGDIKPSNIMLRDSGGAVLIDLGAARYLSQDNTPAAREPFGTRGYFSPEQARAAKSLSCASDIFSLGVVMLQALMGRHPTDYSQSALADGIRLSDLRLVASPSLRAELDKMLAAKPTARPQPAELSRRFHRLYQSVAEFAVSPPARPQTAESAYSVPDDSAAAD
jgi:serine/threonine protein kinase